jgi:hypothetical protein
MVDLARDQRSSMVLVDPAYRERLARVEGPFISDYVAWAADLAQNQRAVQNETKYLQFLRSLYDNPAFEWREEWGPKWTRDEWMRHCAEAEQLINVHAGNTQVLYEAWCRNIDLEISKGGKSRQEQVQAVAHETGRVLPAEMVPRGEHAQAPTTVQIVQANGNGHKPSPPKKQWYGLGGKK